jgi:hypothetical protein
MLLRTRRGYLIRPPTTAVICTSSDRAVPLPSRFVTTGPVAATALLRFVTTPARAGDRRADRIRRCAELAEPEKWKRPPVSWQVAKA